MGKKKIPLTLALSGCPPNNWFTGNKAETELATYLVRPVQVVVHCDRQDIVERLFGQNELSASLPAVLIAYRSRKSSQRNQRVRGQPIPAAFLGGRSMHLKTPRRQPMQTAAITDTERISRV